jgi:hypothetical protein
VQGDQQITIITEAQCNEQWIRITIRANTKSSASDQYVQQQDKHYQTGNRALTSLGHANPRINNGYGI